HNQMWLARKRLGLGQKHVAYLLNHKTTDQISRYEKGWRFPGLKILLQLEIIYGVPARILFSGLHEELRLGIEARVKTSKAISDAYTASPSQAGSFPRFCYCEELLRNPDPSQTERDQVRTHVVTLMRRLSAL